MGGVVKDALNVLLWMAKQDAAYASQNNDTLVNYNLKEIKPMPNVFSPKKCSMTVPCTMCSARKACTIAEKIYGSKIKK